MFLILGLKFTCSVKAFALISKTCFKVIEKADSGIAYGG